jgi:hypothetical protein
MPSISAGTKPATSVPVVSVRYRPTVPLEFASPWGNRLERELSRILADSHALAASTTTRASTRSSRPVALSMYTTPSARPELPVVTSRTMAPVLRVSRPDRTVGSTSTLVEEKFELVLQPRKHCPQ